MAFLSQKSKRGVHTSFYFTKICRPWPCSEQTGVLLEMLFSVWSLKAQHKGLQWRLEFWCKKFKKWKSRSFWSCQEWWDFYCHLLLLSKRYEHLQSARAEMRTLNQYGPILSLSAQNEVLRTSILSRSKTPEAQSGAQPLFQDLKIGPSRLWSLRAGFTILSSSRAKVGPAGFINLALEKILKLHFWNRHFEDTTLGQIGKELCLWKCLVVHFVASSAIRL